MNKELLKLREKKKHCQYKQQIIQENMLKNTGDSEGTIKNMLRRPKKLVCSKNQRGGT